MTKNGNGRKSDFIEKIGNYKIVDIIGEGGMGKVYKAFDPGLNRWVAVKVLSPEFRENPEVAERFHREAEIASRLVHPNVVSIIQYGHDKRRGLLYIVTELLQGEDLECVLQARQPLPFERIYRIMSQVLAALAAAHRFGIVHRDLKPGNVFLLEEPLDFVKILDFGLAKIINEATEIVKSQGLTQEGRVFGTPKYMSPEQVRGKIVDHRTDIYSAGVILYEMITGRPLFLAETAQDTMLLHITGRVEHPRKYREDCPTILAEAVFKALEKEPDNRFASAAAFKSALETAFHPKRSSIVDIFATSLTSIGTLLGKKKSDDRAPSEIKGSSIVSTEFAPTISAHHLPEKTEKAKENERREEAPKKVWIWYALSTSVVLILLTIGIYFFLFQKSSKSSAVPSLVLEKPKVSKSITLGKDSKSGTPVEEWKIRFETAVVLENQKKWEMAETEYQKAAELAPPQEQRAEIWKRIGRLRIRQLKMEEAKEAFQKYLELKPNAPDGAFYRSLLQK